MNFFIISYTLIIECTFDILLPFISLSMHALLLQSLLLCIILLISSLFSLLTALNGKSKSHKDNEENTFFSKT